MHTHQDTYNTTPFPVLQGSLSYSPGDDEGRGQITFYYRRGQRPELPAILADLPIIALEESDYDPESVRLKSSGTVPGIIDFGKLEPLALL